LKFTWKDKEWYIDETLAHQLNSIVYNVKSDWDFVILISGDRTVRIGKSIFAQIVGAYISYASTRMKRPSSYTINDIYFDNKVMMDDSQKKPPYSVNHYDEGREGLAASKSMKSFQQDLMDFFAECGQLNHIFIIVCPDFFELKENMAVGRSEYLINVYRKELNVMRDIFNDGIKRPIVKLQRGYFEFFNRKKKQLLFDISKSTRRKSYSLVSPNFRGRFTNQYTVGEEEYKQKKKDSLARFKERHEKQKEDENTKYITRSICYWKDQGLTTIQTHAKVEAILGKSYSIRHIQRIYKENKENTKENGVLDRHNDNYPTIIKKEGVIDDETD